MGDIQYDYEVWVPACPAQTEALADGTVQAVADAPRLSSAVVCGVVAVLAAALGTVVGVRYSSITVYTQRFTTQGIANTLWLLFFMATACAHAALAVYYGFASHSWLASDLSEVAAAMCSAIAVLGSALALNHHRQCANNPSLWISPKRSAACMHQHTRNNAHTHTHRRRAPASSWRQSLAERRRHWEERSRPAAGSR